MSSLRQQALERLAGGRESWNRWRAGHAYTPLSLTRLRLPQPGLSVSHLRGFDLRNCNLRNATLKDIDASALVAVRCNLDAADFTGAILSGAALGGASLRHASLRGADLSGADLTETHLESADLTNTDLQGADLRGSLLDQAQFTNAVFGWTVLANLDMSRARGLHRAIHRAPSTLGLDVIQRARRRLPEAFLRGVGVAEELIALLSAPLGKRLNLPSAFISYSFKDSAFASQLHQDLQQSGVRCWLAERSLDIGEPIEETIIETIRAVDILIVILSHDAIRSAWVHSEVDYAIAKERATRKRMIVPISIDREAVSSKRGWVAQLRARRKIGDFSAWQDPTLYNNAFESLLHALGARTQLTLHPRWR